MKFEFATATRIVFGAGAAAQLGEIAQPFGRRALLVTGRDPARTSHLASHLKARGIDAAVFVQSGEPHVADVERGAAFARQERCELVIGAGGGSVIDAAKAIAAMMTNPGSLLDYLEIIGRGQSLSLPGAPFVAVPTTAGTGAEVTRNAVLASPAHRVKVSLRSPHLLARVAVVDPELTYDLPPALTAATGMDALTQLIEPYVCLRANPMTDGFCVEGLRFAARSLREVVAHGGNRSAREDMAAASLLGGLALANAGLGAVHGFAGPIGGMFPAPHGAICAALLPHVMVANLRALRARDARNDARNDALRRYAQIAVLLTGNSNATADDGAEWVGKLVADLPISGLSAYGVREEHISDIAAKAAVASSMKPNPIALTPEERADVVRRAL
jgi:alcohol dehydrogenase class IV